MSMFAPNVVNVKYKDFSIAETRIYYRTALGAIKNWKSNERDSENRNPPL